MTTHVLGTDLPRDPHGNLNPFDALRETLAFSSQDHAAAADTAWLYGIILGWDGDPDDPDDDGTGTWDTLATTFGWTPAQTTRLKALHHAFTAAANTYTQEPA